VERAAGLLSTAGYEVTDVVESATPGVGRAAQLAFRLLMNDLDLQLGPVLERLGSEQMRTYWQVVRELSEPYPSIGDYVDDLAARTALLREWLVFLEEYPVLVMPQLLGPLLEVDEDVRTSEDTERVWLSLMPSIAVNLLGLPSLLVPTGLFSGLPAGVQVISSRYREDVCLAAAEVVEAGAACLSTHLWARDR
jgi:amidase